MLAMFANFFRIFGEFFSGNVTIFCWQVSIELLGCGVPVRRAGKFELIDDEDDEDAEGAEDAYEETLETFVEHDKCELLELRLIN